MWRGMALLPRRGRAQADGAGSILHQGPPNGKGRPIAPREIEITQVFERAGCPAGLSPCILADCAAIIAVAAIAKLGGEAHREYGRQVLA